MPSYQFLFQWAKNNRKQLCRDFLGKKDVQKGQKVALFMAGSPGAGKTEFIRRLLTNGEKIGYYTLDLDEIRSWMPGYNGKNAEKYTSGSIKILERLFDECVHDEYPFILDGTFTSTDSIDKNMDRLIRKNYEVSVFYIHTLPELAWLYTLYRGKEEGRYIPVKRFIHDYYQAPKNVCLFADKYPGRIKVYIVNKRYEEGLIKYDLFEFENHMSIHDFFDKHTIIDYNIEERLFKYKWYKFISLIPFLGKKVLKNIILKKEQGLCERHSK